MIDLGFNRILTTGQQDDVDYGIDLLSRLIEYVDGKIGILVGGVNKFNLDNILKSTGTKEVHMASFISKTDKSAVRGPVIHYGASLYPAEDEYQIIDRNAVSEIRKLSN